MNIPEIKYCHKTKSFPSFDAINNIEIYDKSKLNVPKCPYCSNKYTSISGTKNHMNRCMDSPINTKRQWYKMYLRDYQTYIHKNAKTIAEVFDMYVAFAEICGVSLIIRNVSSKLVQLNENSTKKHKLHTFINYGYKQTDGLYLFDKNFRLRIFSWWQDDYSIFSRGIFDYTNNQDLESTNSYTNKQQELKIDIKYLSCYDTLVSPSDEKKLEELAIQKSINDLNKSIEGKISSEISNDNIIKKLKHLSETIIAHKKQIDDAIKIKSNTIREVTIANITPKMLEIEPCFSMTETFNLYTNYNNFEKDNKPDTKLLDLVNVVNKNLKDFEKLCEKHPELFV